MAGGVLTFARRRAARMFGPRVRPWRVPPPVPVPAGPLPKGLGVALDGGTRVLQGGRMLIGGSPLRVIRLSAAGAQALARWEVGALPAAGAERALARRLVDGGLAHPCTAEDAGRAAPEARARPAPTVVIPVKDRSGPLDRLLRALRADAPGGDVLVVDDGSADRSGIAAVAARHRVRLVRRERSGGAAAARNTGLDACRGDLVAFIDSDCVPEPGWLRRLAGHFADPGVGAAAPRVTALRGPGAGLLARYESARSPLDMGGAPARAVPGGPLSYVPSAALVVRRSACAGGFDPRMPVGEDVDLVWRLADAGWAVRYEPSAEVRHDHRLRPGALLRRRFDYGTSAGPLALRHGRRAAPVVVAPWTGAVIALAAARRPLLAAGTAALAAALLVRRTRGADHGGGVPPEEAVRLVGLGAIGTAQWLLTSVGRAWWPLALPFAVRSGRKSALVGAVLVTPHAVEWARTRPPVGLLPWIGLRLADDAAYGAGLWTGAFGCRTPVPVIPVLDSGPSKVRTG